ncbi:hypothetical protein BPT24_291 [Tenacibaculum phage pT24]|uniref:Uncharacterized protein n=1 Tax=Tenacibaculum phage pT24 TaxID=1880590 RepID=A0A1B4XX89_9CAUD|nr:hypothetical protein HYP10_gp236 [Tenacibaculum phage pT24]BAV39409.1 hypothetical protein BPT24_291 [Tenacibaculum phage pT24]
MKYRDFFKAIPFTALYVVSVIMGISGLQYLFDLVIQPKAKFLLYEGVINDSDILIGAIILTLVMAFYKAIYDKMDKPND